ncbi:MAG: T9SS type A sorting domain-containing protein, partial [Dysgonamonadaceae bacterium]|nr:T9SS type A sorting domain-containing protein [Dysgonamonadaceae bacterium]
SNYEIAFVSGVTFEIKKGDNIPTVKISALQVYPNPVASGQTFTVKTDIPDAVIQVFTITGALVKQQEAIGLATPMSLSVPGIYILSVGGEKVKIEVR